MTAAISSRRAIIARSARSRYTLRASEDSARHAGNAACAAATPKSASAGDESANLPVISCKSAGLRCSNVRPLAAGRHSPPMKFLPSKPLMEPPLWRAFASIAIGAIRQHEVHGERRKQNRERRPHCGTPAARAGHDDLELVDEDRLARAI